MQYCPSNHNTLNDTKQRYRSTHYTQRIIVFDNDCYRSMWPILSLTETLHMECQPADICDLQPAGYRPMHTVRRTDPLPEVTHRSKRSVPVWTHLWKNVIIFVTTTPIDIKANSVIRSIFTLCP